MTRANVTAPWKCDSQRATLSLSECSAEIDLTRPWAGVTGWRLDEQDVPCRLFQIDPHPNPQPAEIIDSYTRGQDLVVTYAETEQRPVRQQVYWRAVCEETTAGTFFGLDLIISMQTSHLQSDPTLNVVSELPNGKTLRLLDDSVPTFDELEANTGTFDANDGTSLILHRPLDLDVSIAQCVHPSDFQQADFAPPETGGAALTYRLFRPGLEKGVIRRARLRAAFLARASDEQQAMAVYQTLAAAAPPLTT